MMSLVVMSLQLPGMGTGCSVAIRFHDLCVYIISTENENLIFRGNTFATKAVDTYMKMVGETVRETSVIVSTCVIHPSLSPLIVPSQCPNSVCPQSTWRIQRRGLWSGPHEDVDICRLGPEPSQPDCPGDHGLGGDSEIIHKVSHVRCNLLFIHTHPVSLYCMHIWWLDHNCVHHYQWIFSQGFEGNTQ